MLLSTIIEAVEFDLDWDLNTAWVEDVIVPRVVREYSQWYGKRSSTTISTVADQQSYALPSDCISVIEARWWPHGAYYGETYTAPPIVTGIQSVASPADMLISEIDRAEVLKRLRGKWEVANETTLLLSPIPTGTGQSVTVVYYASHVQSGSGASRAYTTIPDSHLDAIVWLTEAEILLQEANRIARKADYKQGATSVSRSHNPSELRLQAAVLRKRAEDMLDITGPVALAG